MDLDKHQERVHVYKLPKLLNNGFTFSGNGKPIEFLNVDFFDVSWDIPREELEEFIKAKRYYVSGARYLVLAGPKYPTLSFTIEPSE